MPELTRRFVVSWLGILLVCGLLIGSIYSHQSYTEEKVAIEGTPVEPSENQTVLSQEEMTASQYHIANSLLSETIIVQEYSEETWIYTDAETIRVDGNEYNFSVVEPFYTHSVVQVDGSYYELNHSTNSVGKFGYFTIFDMMFLLLFVFTIPMVGSVTKTWWYRS